MITKDDDFREAYELLGTTMLAMADADLEPRALQDTAGIFWVMSEITRAGIRLNQDTAGMIDVLVEKYQWLLRTELANTYANMTRFN